MMMRVRAQTRHLGPTSTTTPIITSTLLHLPLHPTHPILSPSNSLSLSKFSSIFVFNFIPSLCKMNGTLGLLDRGGEVASGGSTTGSMSTVSKEDNLALSSEVSSSYPDEYQLELGLGLSIGGGLKQKASSWGQYARILTAKDFPSSVSKANSSTSGTKRTASDPVSPPNGTSQVVGWPPIRSYRMNSLVSQTKSPADGYSAMVEENKSKNALANSTNNGSNKNNNNSKDRVISKTSLFVKVNMDGTLIGRKVDLNAHSCYETLSHTLENMFGGPTTSIGARRSRTEKHEVMKEVTGPSKLLDGSSEFVLTYEDKDGDWMLVGDVPWRMFLSSVKRLRIMRTSEANGLAAPPRLEEKNWRQKN